MQAGCGLTCESPRPRTPKSGERGLVTSALPNQSLLDRRTRQRRVGLVDPNKRPIGALQDDVEHRVVHGSADVCSLQVGGDDGTLALFHRLDDRAEAEDVVHDVFMSLWAHRHCREIADIDRYLAVAVKYAVLSRLRNRRKRSSILQGLGISMNAASQSEERLDQKLLLERLQGEVERLPDRCRLIFRYSREEGLPVRDIAEILNLSPRTVEHQLSKALRRLRFALRSFMSVFF